MASNRSRKLACALVLFGSLFVLLLAAAPALAAVEGSPHDLIAQGYDVEKTSAIQDRCSRCHIPSSPALQSFLPDVPPVLARSYDASSLMCFSCHDGTTIVSPDVDASRTAFHPASHGSDLAGYEGLNSEGTGLPHLSGTRMECVTCHDPHDDGHRPFLRVDIQDLCLACHSRNAEFDRGQDNHTGNHLIQVDPTTAPRTEAPVKIEGDFRIAFPSSYPLEGGKGSGKWHWSLGGRLAKGDTGVITCTTCHTVHGDAAAPPRTSLLAKDPQNTVANRFCEGCHAGQRGDEVRSDALPNPGGTKQGRTYHPVDDDIANGDDRIVEVEVPADWPLGKGDPPRLLCTSCHEAHGATARTALLRPPSSATTFCESCHAKLPKGHHPEIVDGQGDCSAQVPWLDPTTGIRRSCDLCHRAHNAGLDTKHEENYLPLLRESLYSDASCATCHPEGNATCEKEETAHASHFVGDSTLADGYASADPPLRREAWPETKLTSRYGGEKEQIVLCLSCHTFSPSAIMSGDDGKSGYLLARSGNAVEWTDDEGIYLCTGCHTANPGTGTGKKGHTHPLMEAQVERLGREPVSPATATPAGRVNCDSCHRPHEALSAGAYYILEVVGGQNKDPTVIHPTIDFTVLCHQCHPAEKY